MTVMASTAWAGQIVPVVADGGVDIGYERSLYRVLPAHGKTIDLVEYGHQRSPDAFPPCGP